jgi:hypothetical protein
VVPEDLSLLQLGCGVREEHCCGNSAANVSGTLRLTVVGDCLPIMTKTKAISLFRQQTQFKENK